MGNALWTGSSGETVAPREPTRRAQLERLGLNSGPYHREDPLGDGSSAPACYGFVEDQCFLRGTSCESLCERG